MESSQLKSDILGLGKELKAVAASLEKEWDGLKKDLEELKTKLGGIMAKLKPPLVEKNKVEVGDVHYLVHLLWDIENVHNIAY